MIKLPKQWGNWCRDSKLKVHGRRYGKKQSDWLCLKGRGHYWCVNCYGMFQRGDAYEHYEQFDRWALCDTDGVPMPTSRSEFRAMVKFLLEQAND